MTEAPRHLRPWSFSQDYTPPQFQYEESADIIINSSGTHFDPEIVKVFVDLKEEFRAIRDGMKD
jgi:response regulator RpfG family c-di-GMP phosphodiesterase